jgi:hypothetical protein
LVLILEGREEGRAGGREVGTWSSSGVIPDTTYSLRRSRLSGTVARVEAGIGGKSKHTRLKRTSTPSSIERHGSTGIAGSNDGMRSPRVCVGLKKEERLAHDAEMGLFTKSGYQDTHDRMFFNLDVGASHTEPVWADSGMGDCECKPRGHCAPQ